eukprot:796280-Pleurochrysis_carterae.AAC.1
MIGERLWQVRLGLCLNVSLGGYLDAAIRAHVYVHSKKLIRRLLQRQLESIPEDSEIVVCLSTSGLSHPAVIHVQDQVDPMPVG